MNLTAENYYSSEADQQFMSYSQYKSFLKCQAATMAALKGDYIQEDKETFLVGKFVHAWSENRLDEFQTEHPEMYSSRGKTAGELKSNFKHAEAMIQTLTDDPFCKFVLEGEKEIPIVGEMFGTQWKGKIDVRNAERGYLVDLKTTRSISDTEWIWSETERKNIKVSWIEKYNYMMQAAIYTELDRIVSSLDTRRDFLIVAVDKQDPPDHAVISLKDEARIQEELDKIRDNLPRILAIKNGELEPERCGVCPYCRSTKKINKAIFYTELNPL